MGRFEPRHLSLKIYQANHYAVKVWLTNGVGYGHNLILFSKLFGLLCVALKYDVTKYTYCSCEIVVRWICSLIPVYPLRILDLSIGFTNACGMYTQNETF